MALAGAASAVPAATNGRNCFFSSEWQGWKAPDDKTIYLRVNVRDIYRVDLSSGSPLLTDFDNHLVNVQHGSDYICSPLDLQLAVVENGIPGMRDFVIAKTITKLTPDQIAAIPKKDLP